MASKNVKKLVYHSALAAMIIVATAFMKIAVPVYGGYIHMGDGFIFTAAFCLDPWLSYQRQLVPALQI